MTKIPRRPADTSSTLRDLRVARIQRPVVDELTAITLKALTIDDYAQFHTTPPLIVAMTTRSFHHWQQQERFVSLVDPKDPATFSRHIGQLHAVVRLSSVASIAVALTPALAGADRHAQREEGHAMLRRLEDPETNELRNVIEIAFEIESVDAKKVTADAIEYISRLSSEWQGPASLHELEEQAALRAYLEAAPNVDELIDAARAHADMARRFRQDLRRINLPPNARERTFAAAEGALHQRWIGLARLALAQILPDREAALDHVYVAINEAPQKIAAALILAIAVGDRLRQMVAAHPWRP